MKLMLNRNTGEDNGYNDRFAIASSNTSHAIAVLHHKVTERQKNKVWHYIK
jgi:hypothetical protein